MIDFWIIVILLGIAAAIVIYLCRAKKRGQTCIGCPYAKECAKKHAGQNGCCGNNSSGDT